MANNDAAKEWIKTYYNNLVGYTVVSVDVDDDGDWLWPQLIMTNPAGKRLVIEVSSDEEGNKPGFLFGIPEPAEAWPAVGEPVE